MASQQTMRLPDGQTFTTMAIFGGVGFRSHELNSNHHHAFPAGWTIILHTEDPKDDANAVGNDDEYLPASLRAPANVHPFKKPTLNQDALFISSISNPSSSEFKPAASPTRQIAMMLWVTLYWYFHQPEPPLHLDSEASKDTPDAAKPKGEWIVHIKRDGVLRSKNLIPKLERMGLIASHNTSVGTSLDDNGDEWSDMFVSRRMFWQIPGRQFLFTLAPNRSLASYPGSPVGSRSASPTRTEPPHGGHHWQTHSQSPLPTSTRAEFDLPGGPIPTTMLQSSGYPIGPFFSTSHLPTYYPPPPLQYTFTNGIRHPLRPKPVRMGETFYSRFVPSVGQYISFRIASASPKPVPHLGPVGPKPPQHSHLCTLSDTSLMQMWMANPRVKKFWGEYHPQFLNDALSQTHSFPVIGLWDGVPFGYFEVYWVKEDILGRHLGSEADDWDRGLHVFIGEEWARGRVSAWLTGLVHWCLTADQRTMNVVLEPRVDNEGFLKHLDACGFAKEKKVSFPHKQSCVDFTVRSGGNDFYGRYVVDDGLIIDVRELNNVAISDDRQTASIGGGVTARSLASQLEDDGYICPVGNTGEIGYVGWATLGGYGPLTNKLGMGYEGIVGAEVVNARGEIVQAGEEMLEGIRGMGGNLGVITKLIIRIYPKFQLLSGMVMFEANPENVHAIVEAEAELEVPKEATMHYFIIDAGGRSVAMSFTWASDNHEKGKEFLDRLLTRLPPPKMNMVASKSLVGYFDSVRPPCLPWGCQRSIYVKELSTGLINILMDSLKVIPPQVNIAWSMTIQAQRAQSPPNCFGAATHMLLSFSDMTSSEDALAAARSWNDELYTKLRGSGDEALLDGSYPPLTRPADRTAEQLFGNKWPRARELKETFDPENVYKWAVPRFAA